MGIFDNNERDEEKKKKALKEYNLGITNEADELISEYLEDSLKEGISNGTNIINEKITTTDGGKVTVYPPEFKSLSGAFVAWMISEKDMSVEQALENANPRNENAQGYVNEFLSFVMTHSIVLDNYDNAYVFDVNENAFVPPEGANEFKKIFAKASKKITDYKLPDIDYSDPKAVKKVSEDLSLLKSLGIELNSQATLAIASKPYKLSDANVKAGDAFMHAIVNGKAQKPADVFKAEYGSDYKDAITEIRKSTNSINEVLRYVERCYGRETPIDTPTQLLTERNYLKKLAGSTLKSASGKVDGLHNRSDNASKVLEFEYEISEKRIVDRLKGKEDPKLDEAVNDCTSLSDGTLSSKVKSQMKVLDKNGYRKNYIKRQTRDNLDLDFKLMSEIKGEIIVNEINSFLENKEMSAKIDETDKKLLKRLADAINSTNKNTEDALKKQDYYMFNGSKVIKDAYLPLNGINYKKGDVSEHTMIDYYSTYLKNLGEINQIYTTMTMKDQDTPYPDSVLKILNQTKSVIDADDHFLTAINDLQLNITSLPQAKKAYGQSFPAIRNNMIKLQSNVLSKKKEDKKLNVDDLEKADLENVKTTKKDTALLLNIDSRVNVKKYIEKIQKEIKQKGDMTFDQFVDILAARAAINAERNNKKALDRDVSTLKIAKYAEEIQKSALISQFFENAKGDPKKWAALVDSAKSGHGGEIEDKIKKYSNLVPIIKLGTDPINERFVTTPKERIEAWKTAYGQKGISTPLIASEILIMRNIAEAKEGVKSSLDKPITAQMLKQAYEQDKVLRKEDEFASMVNGIKPLKRDELFTSGHGGKLAEYIRLSGDSYKYKDCPGTKKILEQNTLIGKLNNIENKIKGCEKATGELYKNVNAGLIKKTEFDQQLNEYFPRLVAESVVINDLITKAKEETSQRKLRVDIGNKDFEKKVTELMNSADFNENYKMMMSPQNMPKKFEVNALAESYKAADAKIKAAAEKEKNKDVQHEQMKAELAEAMKKRVLGN